MKTIYALIISLLSGVECLSKPQRGRPLISFDLMGGAAA
jgi:hypothetical protein